MGQEADDPLSSVLTESDLLGFQNHGTGRVRNYPAVKTLSLFIRQVISEDKSCRNILIADVADQTALKNKRYKCFAHCPCKQLIICLFL